MIKKGESKIIRQQTGYNFKTRQLMNESKKLDDEIQKVKDEISEVTGLKQNFKLDHTESGNSLISYRPDADWDSRKTASQAEDSPRKGRSMSTVSEGDIADSLADLRLLLQVFEDNACNFLFKDKYLISVEDATEAFREKLRLSDIQAHKLARYLLEHNAKGSTGNKINTLNKRDLLERIDRLVGRYRKYDKEETHKLIESFFLPQNEGYRIRFLNEMNDLKHIGNVTKIEFEKTIGSINLDINLKSLIIMLLRESESLHTITGEAINDVVELIKKEEKSLHKSSGPSMLSSKPKQNPYDEYKSSQKKEETKVSSEDMNLNRSFFVRLAEFMFNNDLTLYQIIHTKIYDKMFNGREYELINSKSFFKLLAERGFTIDDREKKAVSTLLKNSYLIDVIEVEKISKILEELMIKEDIPAPSKNFNYKHLTAPDIRLMNKVVQYMEEHNIEEIEDFVGKERIKLIEVVGNKKKEDIQVINAHDFLQSLIEKNLIDDDELNEGLQMFFAISVDNMDKLMLRKIKK